MSRKSVKHLELKSSRLSLTALFYFTAYEVINTAYKMKSHRHVWEQDASFFLFVFFLRQRSLWTTSNKPGGPFGSAAASTPVVWKWCGQISLSHAGCNSNLQSAMRHFVLTRHLLFATVNHQAKQRFGCCRSHKKTVAQGRELLMTLQCKGWMLAFKPLMHV